jgi:transcriptional regulator with XRE-family HTH domain
MKHPNINPKYVKKVKEVSVGYALKNQPLTPETYAIFLSFKTKEERNQYAWRLRKEEGWSLESIGQAINVTREMVRLIVKNLDQTSFTLLPSVASQPIPKRVRVEKVKYRRTPIEPEALKRLKELHATATLLRGKSEKNRTEAEEFTRLINEQTLLGVSTYTIAKELGLTVGAINLRLVRYGYRKTNGQSRALTRIKYSTQKKEATHDNTTTASN